MKKNDNRLSLQAKTFASHPGIIIIVFCFLLFISCKQSAQPTFDNKPPDTIILSYTLNPEPELDSLGQPTIYNKATVFWTGVDADGQILYYEYSTDSIHYDSTTKSQSEFLLDFTQMMKQHKIWVRAVDNSYMADPSPASVMITKETDAFETLIIDGPPNEAIVSRGVRFKIFATSASGEIVEILYKVDDSDWLSQSVHSGFAGIDITGMSLGRRTIQFAGKNEYGDIDETPIIISLTVRDGFAPILVLEQPVMNGDIWIAGGNIKFMWHSLLEHYYGSLADRPYCFTAGTDLSPPDEYNLNPEEAFGDGWSLLSSFDYIPGPADNIFYLKVRDIGGGVDTLRFRFHAIVPSFDKGVLVVSDISPPVPELYRDKIISNAYWGEVPVDFWDTYGDLNFPSIEIDPEVDYVGGGKIPGMEILSKYSSLVWLGNGADKNWNSSIIAAYLQAGGNVVLASIAGQKYLDDFLCSTLHIVPRDDDGYVYSATIYEAKAIFQGLLDLGPPFSVTMDETSVFSSYGFNSGGSLSNDDVTDWDGVRCFSESSGTSTLLFTHRNHEVIGDFGYVRGIAVWGHPNLVFSDLTAVDFPTPGTDETQGNFIFIGARHYGFDQDACRHNFEFILKNLFAEK